MKIVILLSLVAICEAKRHNGRSSFQYPGQPSSDNSKNFLLNDFADIASLNPERARRNFDTGPSKEPVELQNPNRKDVKIGNFPAHGFSGNPKGNEIKELPDIFLSVVNKSPLIKQVEPSFIKNSIQVLEKDKSASSEESKGPDNEENVSGEQDSELAVANNQQESTSSEVRVEPAVKQEESSSSEESNAPVVNQEESLQKIPSSQSTPEKEDLKEEKEEEDEEPSIQPFVVAKFINFATNAPRKRGSRVKYIGRFQQPSPRKAYAPGSRPIRGVEFDFPDLKLDIPRKNIQEPQGQAKGASVLRRGRRPVKK